MNSYLNVNEIKTRGKYMKKILACMFVVSLCVFGISVSADAEHPSSEHPSIEIPALEQPTTDEAAEAVEDVVDGEELAEVEADVEELAEDVASHEHPASEDVASHDHPTSDHPA